MVFVVKNVEERGHERMQVLCANPLSVVGLKSQSSKFTHIEDRELGQDSAELLIESVLCKLDFSHVKVANTTNLEVFVDDLEE